MSIENNLSELTAAVRELTAAITSKVGVSATLVTLANEVTPAPAPAAVPAKATRTRKSTEAADPAPVQVDAPAATPAQTDTPASGVEVNEGDPIGTRYFHVPAHNTVYRQLPGMADCTLPGSQIVSGAEYLRAKAEIEKKFPTAAAVAAPVTVEPVATAPTAPTATAPAATASATSDATFEVVIEAVRALNASVGREGVVALLKRFDVPKVPMLQGKASNNELIAAINDLALGL